MANGPLKALIMLRGLPGSGKSTLAALLGEQGRYPVFCIDDYFTDQDGKYNFDFSKNHIAYRWCEERCETAMKEGHIKVIVENVFSLDWEMEPYFKMAALHGYMVHVLTLENRHGGRNVHYITDEQVAKMASKYQVRLF